MLSRTPRPTTTHTHTTTSTYVTPCRCHLVLHSTHSSQSPHPTPNPRVMPPPYPTRTAVSQPSVSSPPVESHGHGVASKVPVVRGTGCCQRMRPPVMPPRCALSQSGRPAGRLPCSWSCGRGRSKSLHHAQQQWCMSILYNCGSCVYLKQVDSMACTKHTMPL